MKYDREEFIKSVKKDLPGLDADLLSTAAGWAATGGEWLMAHKYLLKILDQNKKKLSEKTFSYLALDSYWKEMHPIQSFFSNLFNK